jgi:pyridoxal 5'-phosphate synthase pdxS subunit
MKRKQQSRRRPVRRAAAAAPPRPARSAGRPRGQVTLSVGEQFRLKVGLAEMLKGGVIMDVMTADQARIAEEAGACAVMALERIPARIRREGGVARMSDPKLIREIEAAVSVPVMAKVRIGHLAEAQILEALGVDFIDESEVLTPADEENHIDKHGFKVPFVCGCRDLGEALRRVGEGAAMIRTKGEAGTGDIVEAVRHMRAVQRELRRVAGLRDDELMAAAKQLGAPYEIVRQVKALGGRLPVPNFAAGGVATPADASLMMQLGAESVFVGSGIFEVGLELKPEEQRREQLRMARAIVQAVANYDDPELLARISEGLPRAMKGVAAESVPVEEQMAKRGW